jgi:amino acid permease
VLLTIILGMGPKAFAYVDKQGRPIVVTVLQLLFGCLAFINLAPSGGVIFDWLLALSGLSSFFIYGSIAIAHIRFRSAWFVFLRYCPTIVFSNTIIGNSEVTLSTNYHSKPLSVSRAHTSALS